VLLLSPKWERVPQTAYYLENGQKRKSGKRVGRESLKEESKRGEERWVKI